jgi:hypothetical protein
MQLPIDARKAPFKTKYLDEETPMLARWMVTGTSDVGAYFVGDADLDVVVGLTDVKAAALIKARDQFVNAVLEVINGSSPHWPVIAWGDIELDGCPQCGGEGDYDARADLVTCQSCGWYARGPNPEDQKERTQDGEDIA